MATETPKVDKRKNPHAVKFVPASKELLDAIAKDNGFTLIDLPERKTKGGGVRPARKIKLANSYKTLLGFFNNDAKAFLYHGSILVDALEQAHLSKNSVEAMAKKSEAKAVKITKGKSIAELEAMLAAITAAKNAALATASQNTENK